MSGLVAVGRDNAWRARDALQRRQTWPCRTTWCALHSDIGPIHGCNLATLAAILSIAHVTSIFTRLETFLYILASSQQYLIYLVHYPQQL
jgi:hypothetical protein